jgi:hypothetical protein
MPFPNLTTPGTQHQDAVVQLVETTTIPQRRRSRVILSFALIAQVCDASPFRMIEELIQRLYILGQLAVGLGRLLAYVAVLCTTSMQCIYYCCAIRSFVDRLSSQSRRFWPLGVVALVFYRGHIGFRRAPRH